MLVGLRCVGLSWPLSNAAQNPSVNTLTSADIFSKCSCTQGPNIKQPTNVTRNPYSKSDIHSEVQHCQVILGGHSSLLDLQQSTRTSLLHKNCLHHTKMNHTSHEGKTLLTYTLGTSRQSREMYWFFALGTHDLLPHKTIPIIFRYRYI